MVMSTFGFRPNAALGSEARMSGFDITLLRCLISSDEIIFISDEMSAESLGFGRAIHVQAVTSGIIQQKIKLL